MTGLHKSHTSWKKVNKYFLSTLFLIQLNMRIFHDCISDKYSNVIFSSTRYCRSDAEIPRERAKAETRAATGAARKTFRDVDNK